MTLLYLSRDDVRKAVGEVDCVAAVREMFELHASAQVVLPEEAYLRWTPAEGGWARSLCLPGYLGGSFHAAGLKVINANPANPDRGIARADGLSMVFDPETARIMCLMEGAYLSALRTAAVSALAADMLARQATDTMLVIGSGVLASAHLELLPARLPALRRILLFDMVPQRAQILAESAQKLLPAIEVRAVEDLEAAIRQAALIVAVTTTDHGYIPFEWLAPGALIINVSLDDVCPDVVLGASKVVVDDWALVSQDTHRLLGRMYRAGDIDYCPAGELAEGNPRRWVDATIGELVTGKREGRVGQDDVILVNPFGMALADVAVTTRVHAAAVRSGLGIRLPR